jgi:hypothetical protein
MQPLNRVEIGKEMIECPAPLVLRKAAHRHPMHLFFVSPPKTEYINQFVSTDFFCTSSIDCTSLRDWLLVSICFIEGIMALDQICLGKAR